MQILEIRRLHFFAQLGRPLFFALFTQEVFDTERAGTLTQQRWCTATQRGYMATE
jgi:hypothetical protein